MDSNEEEQNVSPAEFLYEGLPQLLPEYDSLLIQLAVLHLTIWQILFDRDRGIGRPPVNQWIDTLQRIPSQEENPLEELFRQAPEDGVERTDDIEDFSDDNEQQDGQDEQQEQQQQQEGTEDNPVDVDRDRDRPQFRIVDSTRVFDHPASAGFRYRRSSGQQFRVGERRGPYLRRGSRKTGFR